MANIIKQLKDNDGNNIYPIAYAQGGMKMDLLWTNPNPSSNFEVQTINIDMSNYDLLVFCVYENTDNTVMFSNIITKSQKQTRFVSVNANMITYRIFDFGQNHVSLTAQTGSIVGTYGSATVDNSKFIPYQIYGIEMSYVIPTQVHGLQYVEVE